MRKLNASPEAERREALRRIYHDGPGQYDKPSGRRLAVLGLLLVLGFLLAACLH